MSVRFIVGDKDAMLNEIGVPYGWIFVENLAPAFVVTMKHGREKIRKVMENQLITANEAVKLEFQMKQARIFEDWSEIRKQVATYQPPDSFESGLCFEMCSGCRIPIPHGNIERVLDYDYKVAVETVYCFNMSFGIIAESEDLSEFDPVEKAVVLSQIAQSSLPVDDLLGVLRDNVSPVDLILSIIEKLARSASADDQDDMFD